MVCKLIKVLYRLKQAPDFWYMTLVESLKKLGFTRLGFDYGVFVSADKQLYIAVYVDDLLLSGLDIPRLEGVQQKLRDRFKMADVGEHVSLLGKRD